MKNLHSHKEGIVGTTTIRTYDWRPGFYSLCAVEKGSTFFARQKIVFRSDYGIVLTVTMTVNDGLLDRHCQGGRKPLQNERLLLPMVEVKPLLQSILLTDTCHFGVDDVGTW